MGHAIDDPACRRLPPLLRSSWFGLNQAFRRRLSGLGLTPNQFTLLRWLDEAGPEGLTQKCVVCAMSSDANTVAALVERMVADRLITRRVDPEDRRARRLRLAAKGKRLYAEARPIALALQEEALADIPPAQREAFLTNLERLARACQQANEASEAVTAGG